jgi:hypothetical protein
MFRRHRQCRAPANPGTKATARCGDARHERITAGIVAPAAVIAARPHSSEKRIIVLSGLLAMP